MSSEFMVAEEVVCKVGTFIGNSAYYKADYSFVPTGNLKPKASATNGLFESCVMVSDDSWSNYTLNGAAKNGDCEDSASIVIKVLHSFANGRHDLNKSWESSSLRAVQKVLLHTTLYLVGSTVTAAYVNTDNEKIDLKDKDLAMIGDEMDRRAKIAGHCFIMAQPQTQTIRMVINGKDYDENVLNAMKKANHEENKAFIARDSQRKMLVLEPTGGVEPRITPTKESYEGHEKLCNKRLAERYFMKSAKKHLDEMKKKENGRGLAIHEMFSGDCLPHYAEKQSEKRVVSSFYNTVVMATSTDLVTRFGLDFTQLAFCKPNASSGKHEYGVRMGELLRNPVHSRLALVCPYRKKTAEWYSQVLPMMETLHNQMPIMTFGRYTEKEYEESISSHYVSQKEMESDSLMEASDSRQFDTLLESTLESDNATVVRLYTRCWKLTESKAKTAALKKFLSSLPGMINYGFYVQHFVPVCDPIVEILCVIDVALCNQMGSEFNK